MKFPFFFIQFPGNTHSSTPPRDDTYSCGGGPEGGLGGERGEEGSGGVSGDEGCGGGVGGKGGGESRGGGGLGGLIWGPGSAHTQHAS